MKLLVDEMPYYKDDCLFAEPKWSDEEEFWVSYCKFTNERCDLDEEQCSCLLRSEPQTETSTKSRKVQLTKCRNSEYYETCEYTDKCNPAVCFKALDELMDRARMKGADDE